MAHDVFVSHSSKDKPAADAVCAVLEAQGIRCWVAPRDIIPGRDWGESIVEAIKGARVMVLIFSANANNSEHIKREVERAANWRIPIIPLRIEDVVPTASLEYFLSTPHWLDAFTPPLENHLQHLAQVVRQILGVAPAETSFVPAPLVGAIAPEKTGAQKAPPVRSGRFKPAWLVAAAAFALLLGLGGWYFGMYRPELQRSAAAVAGQAQREVLGWVSGLPLMASDNEIAAVSEKVELYVKTAPAERAAEVLTALEKHRSQILAERERVRLANARGGLIIRTDPPGAEVRVGGFAVEKGPQVTLKEVKIGKYGVTVIAPGYEDFRADVDVKENDFAELRATLVRSTGTLQIESAPPGLAYGLQGETPERLERSGRTPAKLADLPTGSYRVTVQRDGWPQPVVETAVVERQKTTLISAEIAAGTLIITSDPAGAVILQNGKEVAHTPWRSESVPGDYAFEIRLKGYEVASISGTLAAKNELRLNAALEKQVLSGPSQGQAWTVPKLNLEMAYIWPGTFTMGSPVSEIIYKEEHPQTQVTLTRGYWLGKTEVSQAQWEALMGSNPSGFKEADRPVETVSWDDVMGFCRKLTERERWAGRLPGGYEYTLPTEAQWEYACRAGTTGPYGGDGNLDDMGWYYGNSGQTTHRVGQKQANAWGLYDMHGNVSEWCLDWFVYYPGGSVRDPTGPSSGLFRVCRGGSWGSFNILCRSAFRGPADPRLTGTSLGFRLALAPTP
jgi:formylglycine-generating enzyme required for sulfatase activity